MKLGGLFEGIGGFPLAATWAGITPVWSNEIDPFCCKVLRKNFNHEIIEEDIRKIGKHNLGSVDIISGGFPCQPFSSAGLRKGTNDDRYLWPEYLRIIRELRPTWIVAENVAGLITMENGKTLERILSDLENENYFPEIYNIPACGVGAWHRRERIWIIANFTGTGGFKHVEKCGIQSERDEEKDIRGSYWDEFKLVNGRVAPEKWKRKGKGFDSRPLFCRNDNGLSSGLDRLKGLGNAIVPQVAYEIFKAITKYERVQRNS